ncbi:MAG: beta-propeller domain-containing protein [Candidatus Aenigmarchaeota archaeon]|nr:beta-propeller domain-containing protein [Candidatus Aenigmarchaeota archaeon]
MSKSSDNFLTQLFVVVVLSIVFILVSSVPTTEQVFYESEGIKSFYSEQDFKDYLEESSELTSGLYSFGAPQAMSSVREGGVDMVMEETAGGEWEKSAEPGRVSETNVQVLGIDEPDIVKTDGKKIYYSAGRNYWRNWGYDYNNYKGETKIISAFPPESLLLKTEISNSGDLLLHNNILVIFSGNKIYGYDVSNSESPKEEWNVELNTSLVTARLYNGKIYLVTKKAINHYRPCPIVPLSIRGIPINIECSRIYYPASPMHVDTTYNAIILNPGSGEIEKTISFVGSSGSTVIYMSENAIYVSYQYYKSMLKFYYTFLKEDCKDLIDSAVIERLGKVVSYDLSDQAKMMEMQIIFEKYFSSLSDDERMRVRNEFSNRMENYYKEHKRELEKTGIAKIGLDMEMSGSGNIPGRLLNQFSMDEYNNHLRVATTVGTWSNSANDVYVLDENMGIVGSVKDLGETERIYSVRFLQDKGYVVTFRKIDPFYVLDLSNPANPELKGELKIPGYSSYLHPITKDKILGMGKEDSKIKISLFDVSSPENPTEADKYILDEYWSDILNTHHAFLIDKKHKIFFLPGSKGGYVFSYENDELKLKKTVSNIRAKRAIYIDDYLYIIGEDKLVVLDENTWERVEELDL